MLLVIATTPENGKDTNKGVGIFAEKKNKKHLQPMTLFIILLHI